MDDDGVQHDLTFEELDAFSRFPFSEGQLFLAMMTADVKFSPRYAKVFIRTKRLYMLDEDLEIIDLTMDVGTTSNTSTPSRREETLHQSSDVDGPPDDTPHTAHHILVRDDATKPFRHQRRRRSTGSTSTSSIRSEPLPP